MLGKSRRENEMAATSNGFFKRRSIRELCEKNDD